MTEYITHFIIISSLLTLITVILSGTKLEGTVRKAVSVILVSTCIMPFFAFKERTSDDLAIFDTEVSKNIEYGEYGVVPAVKQSASKICKNIESAIYKAYGTKSKVSLELDVSNIDSIEISGVKVEVATGNKEKINSFVGELLMCENVCVVYKELLND